MNKRIRQILTNAPGIQASPAHMEQTAEAVRLARAREPARERMGFPAFLLRQVRYIGWGVWLWQAAVLCGLLVAFYNLDVLPLSRQGGWQVVLGCCAVGIALAGLPFYRRSQRYHMEEIELGTRFSAARLLLARMVIIGLCNMAALAIVLLAARSAPLPGAAVYLLLPYLAASVGCAHITERIKGRLGGAVCVAFGILLTGALYALWARWPQAFAPGAVGIWGAVCAVLALLLAIEAAMILKKAKQSDYLEEA